MDECSEINCLNFLGALEGKGKRAAIFTHAFPDPDAIGSIMALEWLLNKMGNYKCTGFFSGCISHPQNKAMVNLLEPNLKNASAYNENDFDVRFLVDTVPSHAGVGDHKVKFDVVIDHHRETASDCVYINLKAGSACATVYHLIDSLGYHFEEDNEHDSKVATAIMVGISTDTESLMSDDTTSYEFAAWSKVFEFKNSTILKKIVNYERPKFWIDHKAAAVRSALITEGIGIVGVGNIPGNHRDLIADMADDMVKWEEVHTAIAFAVVEGDRIEGSVRSRNASVMVPDFCKSLGAKYGQGGGKYGKGAYSYSLSGGGIDEDDDEEINQKTWELLRDKEIRRILRVKKE